MATAGAVRRKEIATSISFVAWRSVRDDIRLSPVGLEEKSGAQEGRTC